MSRRFAPVLAAASLMLAPAAAFAHAGGPSGHIHGFAAGFAHPLGGLDHVLAMVAVGLLAAEIGGRALWTVPAAFLGMMALGGALGMAGMSAPALETAIALSVVVLGLAASLRIPLGGAAAATLVGFFAVFHGVAHGAEAGQGVSGLSYAGGFLLATALLHACGLGSSLGLSRLGAQARLLPQAAAVSIAILGVGLLAGWI